MRLALAFTFLLAACSHPAIDSAPAQSGSEEAGSYPGLWSGTIDGTDDVNVFEITKDTLRWRPAWWKGDWAYEAPYGANAGAGKPALVLADYEQMLGRCDDIAHDERGEYPSDATCPEVYCAVIEEVDADTLKMSFGHECDEMQHVFVGTRQP
jgi:hypothetical protein